MGGIRVTYSGLISFAVGLISILTGTIFTLIVTRSLSPEEFGTWNLIGGIITYVIIVEPIISYWATREIARGVESGKTALFSSGIFSLGATSLYIIISYFLAINLHADQGILLFAGILVPLMFLNRTLTSINLGWKPQSTSYGILAFESTKIPAGLIFVYFFHLGIFGAILSTIIAYIASIFILFAYAKEKISTKFNVKILKTWIKRLWVAFYPGISSAVYHIDVVIFSAITGSVVGLAFYSASQTVSNIVGNSSLISQALYPKLLAGGRKEHLQENLIRFFYFAFPLTSLSIVFAKPALFALKPIYEIAIPVVIFMSIRAFLYVLGQIFNQAALGIETVDIDEKSTPRDFIKSKLFFIPTLVLIQYSLYVIILTIGLVILKPSVTSFEDLVVYWSIVSLGTQIPFTIYYYLLVRKHFTVKVNTFTFSKYLLSSIVSFGITYFLIEHFLNYKKSIFEFIPNLLLFVGIGISLYFGLTYLIDLRTREFFRTVIKEILGKSNE